MPETTPVFAHDHATADYYEQRAAEYDECWTGTSRTANPQPKVRTPPAGVRTLFGHAMAQAVPLSVNVAGFAVLPVWAAWKPMLVDAPGAKTPL